MRFVIIICVGFAVLFALAAGGSILLINYFDQKNKAEHTEASAADTGKDKDLPPLARGAEGGPRSRPGSAAEPDERVQEHAKLRERQEAVRLREQQVNARQKALEIIKEDIKSERDDVDKLRKQVTEQMKGAEDDVAAANRKMEEVEQKTKEEQQLLKDAKRGIYEVEGVRAKGIKQVGGIADTAEPAEVAAIFERMVESGTSGVMTAAQILANMKDRRAAQVLSALQDKALAAELLEKMVGLKQSASAGPANPLGGGVRPPRTQAPADGR